MPSCCDYNPARIRSQQENLREEWNPKCALGWAEILLWHVAESAFQHCQLGIAPDPNLLIKVHRGFLSQIPLLKIGKNALLDFRIIFFMVSRVVASKRW